MPALGKQYEFKQANARGPWGLWNSHRLLTAQELEPQCEPRRQSSPPRGKGHVGVGVTGAGKLG